MMKASKKRKPQRDASVRVLIRKQKFYHRNFCKMTTQKKIQTMKKTKKMKKTIIVLDPLNNQPRILKKSLASYTVKPSKQFKALITKWLSQTRLTINHVHQSCDQKNLGVKAILIRVLHLRQTQ